MQQRVGICFSGGGARGIAHLGVLQALDELKIPVSVISGTSSGAIVGAFYAAGISPEQTLQLICQTNIPYLMRPAFNRFGLLNLDEVEKVVLKAIGDITFENLKLPLIISATDINQANIVYFSKGHIIKPLLAACSMPMLYRPIEIDGKFLVDGGLMNNLPVECLTDRCDYIIGVHCNPINRNARVSTFKGMVERTFHIAINNNVQQRLRFCDLLIEPPGLKHFSLLHYRKAKEIFEIGYAYAMELQDQLRHLTVQE